MADIDKNDLHDLSNNYRDTHDHDLTYENEQSKVTIPLKEYDKLKDQSKYITDDTLIGYIDKIEFFVKEIRKHIVRKW